MATTRLGGARIDLTGQSAQLETAMARASKAWDQQEKKLKRAQAQARRTNKAHAALNKTIGGLVGAVGVGAAVAGLKAAVTDAAAFSTQLVEGARNTGLLETRLEAIAHIFKQDGIGFQATTTALATFQKRISEVGDGLATYTRSFDKLGLSYEKLKELSPEEQFLTLLEAIAAVEDQTIKQQAAQDLLGRAGKQLVGTIDQLGGRWREAVAAADALTGATVEQHRRSKELTGAFETLEQRQRDVAVQFSAENAKGILFWASVFTDLKVAALEGAAALGEFLAAGTGYIDADERSQRIVEAQIQSITEGIEKLDGALRRMDSLQGGQALQIMIQRNKLVERRIALEKELLAVFQAQRPFADPYATYPAPAPQTPVGSAEVGEHYTDPYGPMGLEAHYEKVNAATERGRKLLADLTEQRKRDAEATRDQTEAEKAFAAEVEAARIRLAGTAGGGRGGDPRVIENEARLARWEAERKAEEAHTAFVEKQAGIRMNLLLETARAQIDAARNAEQAWMSAAEGMVSSATSAFSAWISGTKSAEDAFRGFAQGVIDALLRIAQEAAALKLFGFLAGLFAGGGNSFLASGSGRVPVGFARGGFAPAGRARVVGETGPELEFPAYQTRVVPFNKLAGAGGGGETINVTVYGADKAESKAGVLEGILAARDVQQRKRMRYPNATLNSMKRGLGLG